MRRRGQSAGIASVLVWLLLLAPASAAEARPAPLIAAAGDIACGPNNPRYNNGFGTFNSCQQFWTSNLLQNRDLAAVLPLGDLEYDDNGSLASFQATYAPTWGRWKSISHPVVGNHEYDDGLGAQGYWDYWNGIGNGNGRAGVRGRGWYAYNLGSWRLIALNSICEFVACRGSSRQLRFLRNQLERYRDRCVLAYMHNPRFSSGIYEEIGDTRAIWKALYRGGADVVLNGHDHIYERFAPMDANGAASATGVREFVVGTGGKNHTTPGAPQPNSVVRNGTAFGVLQLTLHADTYDWQFLPITGQTFTDAGTGSCQ